MAVVRGLQGRPVVAQALAVAARGRLGLAARWPAHLAAPGARSATARSSQAPELASSHGAISGAARLAIHRR
jgi:hypothetical protein